MSSSPATWTSTSAAALERAARAAASHRIHAEGGPTLLAELVAADLLDELLLTVSPLLAGGTYADRTTVTRILAGSVLDDAPRPMRLHQVLEDDDSLFLSYRRP